MSDVSDSDIAKFSIKHSGHTVDFATVVGLLLGMSLIVAAILSGDSNASFINLPSVMIVLLGTMAVTAVSFSGREILSAGKIIYRTALSKTYAPSETATQLVELSAISRKHGILALGRLEDELAKEPFLERGIQMLTDGLPEHEIEDLMNREINSLRDRHFRSANILRRGSEIAPAMGLIGTLVGLVQMLANLDDPEKIGPAMAVALLTTFYGAIFGTVMLSPLAAKLERNSDEEIMVKTLILNGVMCIARQENPRKVEMLLNTILPPQDAIQVMD